MSILAEKRLIEIPDEYRPAIEELPGELSRIAAEIERYRPGAGVDTTLMLAQVFPGQPLYIRNIRDIIRKMRDDAIRREYDSGGCTMLELASSYNLSHPRVKQILADPGDKPDNRQQRLF